MNKPTQTAPGPIRHLNPPTTPRIPQMTANRAEALLRLAALPAPHTDAVK